MATISTSVISIAQESVPLPPWSGRFEALLTYFAQSGLPDWFCRELVLPRGSGYQPIDAFLVAVAYALSGSMRGIDAFLSPLGKRQRAQLATIWGRKTLPGQGSMSRVLAAMPLDMAVMFCRHILSLAHGEVLSSMGDTCLYHDGCGRPLHVFHADQRAYVFRQRALPEGEDLPPPERLPTTLVLPGYPGRKRGETQYSQMRLMHSGTAMWMHLDMAPGSGGVEQGTAHACQEILRFARRNGVGLEDTLLVMDGVDGGYTQGRVCTEAGQPLLTRISDYNRILATGALDHIRNWTPVEDSLSGPSRLAAELGVVTYPGVGEMRTVVSKFPCLDKKKRGAGKVLGEWQHEFFMSHVPEQRLPANNLVTAYYGRSGQENRFAQEDNELPHKHLFSQHLPGQQFMQGTALAVWNALSVLGSRIASRPNAPYAAVFETRPEPAAALVPPEPVEQPAVPTPLVPLEEPAALTPPMPAPEPPAPPASAAMPQESPTAASDALQRCALLPRDYLEPRLKTGFVLSGNCDCLVCSQGHEIRPGWLRRDTDGSVHVRFRTGKGLCRKCPQPCRPSSSPRQRVECNFTIPPQYVSHKLALLSVRQPRRVRSATTTPKPPWRPPPPVPAAAMPLRFPTLVPTLLRRLASSLLGLVILTVIAPLLPEPPLRSGLTAETAALRQHRRKTLRQQLEWNALPEETEVHVTRGIPEDWQTRLPGGCRRFLKTSEVASGADTG